MHEYGISPTDLQAAHTTIAIHSLTGARKVENAIVVFDTIVGGLRLSAPLFAEFADILRRLERGAALAGAEAFISQTELARLQAWFGGLKLETPNSGHALVGDDRWLIYAPGSRVMISIHGQILERELREPQLVAIGGEEKLMYRYDAGDGATGWVADEHITPAGNEWRKATWDPITNAIDILEPAE